jgi:Fic family protein
MSHFQARNLARDTFLARSLRIRIHPYMDGNGRMGRFLMNLMMASGGYPWTVIPVGDRKIYIEALEKASVGEDTVPFGDFLYGLVKKGLAGAPLPAVPTTES